MSNNDVPLNTATGSTASYDIYGWYWQPETTWHKSIADVINDTKEVVALDKTKSETQHLCHRIRENERQLAESMAKIAKRLIT